jgi:hypothetical protein
LKTAIKKRKLMQWKQCPTLILTMPHAHSIPLSFRPGSGKEDPTPPSYALVTRGLSSPSKCFSDPIFNIPKIKVKPPTPRKRSEPLLKGRHLPPMAPLSTRLPWPTQVNHHLLMGVIIDLTNDEGPSSVPQPMEVESQMQVKTSGGMPRLCCRPGGRITTRGYVEPTTQPK